MCSTHLYVFIITATCAATVLIRSALESILSSKNRGVCVACSAYGNIQTPWQVTISCILLTSNLRGRTIAVLFYLLLLMTLYDTRARSGQNLSLNGKAEQKTHGISAVASLEPSMKEWTVKGKVTWKGERTRFRYAKGEGIEFSFDLLDADGGEIRCTCYNTMAGRYYDKVHAGRTYLVSNGSLKPFQNQFTRVNSEWEITLGNSSTVKPCTDDELQHEHDAKPRTPSLVSIKLVKKSSDDPAVLVEEPKTPQRREIKSVPIQNKMLSESSELQVSRSLNPHLHEFKNTNKPLQEERSSYSKFEAQEPSHLESQKLRESEVFKSSLAPASSRKPETNDTGCGDSDVWVEADVEEWIGGPGEPVDPSSYRYAWPTGWD